MTTGNETRKAETMTHLEQLIADEQAFWDDVYRDYPEDGKWTVAAKPAEQKRLRKDGCVAGIVDEAGRWGDVDYVRRLVDGEWSLVPMHQLDE